MSRPILEARGVGRSFGAVEALCDVSLAVVPGRIACLLGDNGAGKSTLVGILSGVFAPDTGQLLIDGEPRVLRSPRAARAHGIATVFQDLALVPGMSVSRNFVLGREPVRGVGPFRVLDLARADRSAREGLARIGIEGVEPTRPVATLSGGERQCLAIARAIASGARVLVLDEPTSALGVAQAALVLRAVANARDRGLGVVMVTHHVTHALALGDRFLLLHRGRSLGSFERAEVDRDRLLALMAGGREIL